MPLLSPRRGRSSTEFTFDTYSLASPICTDTLLLNTLAMQNQFACWREDHDPVYCGDVRTSALLITRILTSTSRQLPPGHLLAGHFYHPFDHPDGIGENEDQLEVGGDTRPSTPEPAPLTDEADTRPVTPKPASRSSERFSSPVTPLPVSRSVSPTLTDVANGWAPTLFTYTRADRRRFLKYRAQREEEAAAKAEAARKRRAQLRGHPTRQSARLLRSDGPRCAGIVNVEAASAVGHLVHAVDPDALTPLVDLEDHVFGAEQAMSRVYRNGQFDNLGREESRVRFGIGYGAPGAYPHHIYRMSATVEDWRFLQDCYALRALSAYQNHLYRLIAPCAYAHLEHQIALLRTRTTLHPVFPGIFTTSEIAFADGPQHSRRNREIQYDTLEAVTVCGDYEWHEHGRIVFWDHDKSVALRPGTTLLFPAGAMRFSFVGVAAHEKICLFRQFCHASVLRWLEKDGLSDTQFELTTSEEELVAFKATRVMRPASAVQMYSKIGEIYVF
ncbi:hypothetical protein DFH07DRAFT_967255 [Mycena maculata]|uniref:Uncharacterized protein n=1 Tax=Mycena maculata TaxID=230809 RepID=A0AAD7I667_9AGAR|nr:hypothetical protein DFH07DRAFT_967255 [Mycena maculata]